MDSVSTIVALVSKGIAAGALINVPVGHGVVTRLIAELAAKGHQANRLILSQVDPTDWQEAARFIDTYSKDNGVCLIEDAEHLTAGQALALADLLRQPGRRVILLSHQSLPVGVGFAGLYNRIVVLEAPVPAGIRFTTLRTTLDGYLIEVRLFGDGITWSVKSDRFRQFEYGEAKTQPDAEAAALAAIKKLKAKRPR